MNTGTKVRTALRIAVSLDTAAFAVSTAIGALDIGWLTFAWGIFVIATDFAVSALTTYYNNDYTPEMAEATGYGRMLKAQKDGEIIGENFFDEVEEVNDNA
jgi:hypothetical protein